MSVMTRELRVQAGTQSTFTTGVTPTVQLRGITELTLRPANDVAMLEDMTLGLAGSADGVVRSVGATGAFQGWATYDDLPYFFDNMMGTATPSGSDPYTRTYAAPIATSPTRRILSVVKGDGTVGAYQLVGGLVQSFTLRIEPGTETTMSGDLVGNKLAADTLASLSVRDVNPIMGSQVSEITWDTWAGSMGSTALTNCSVRFMELSIEPTLTTKPCFGSVTHDTYTEGMWNGSLRLSLEFNSTTKTAVDAIIGGTLTQRQVQITAAKDANNSLELQFAGTVTEDFDIFSDDDGVVTVELTLTRTYHSTFANWFKATVVNTVDALA